jgi:Beta-lactamase enzyme family
VTGAGPGPAALDPDSARAAVAGVTAACSGHVGLAARHLDTGEELSRNPDATIDTASTVKVAIYAEAPRQPPTAPLATATPACLSRLLAGLHAGTVVDRAASAQMITTLRYQQDRSLFPRAYLEVAEPAESPGAQAPAISHKTGCGGGCRADTGLLYLPGNGGVVAYCAAADRLTDQTMSALAEGDEILGRLGAIVLARWWPGPGPVPVRAGWLPAADGSRPSAAGEG